MITTSRFFGSTAGTGRSPPPIPQAGVDDVGVFRIEFKIGSAGVLVLRQHLLERASAIRRPEDAALSIRSVRMSEDCDEQAIRVAWVNDDHRDLLSVAQAEM